MGNFLSGRIRHTNFAVYANHVEAAYKCALSSGDGIDNEIGVASHYVQAEGSCDSLSSGERNGNSPNRTYLYVRGCRAESAFRCGELPSWYIAKSAGKQDPRR